LFWLVPPIFRLSCIKPGPIRIWSNGR